jgi:hypothetical protein
MSQYFNLKKFRRQSKQLDSGPETKPEPATQTETQNTKDTVSSPPAPAVASPSEEPAASPLLDDEDEEFLRRLAALTNEPEGTPPPLPDRPDVVTERGEQKVGKDAQEALMAGADKIPLPTSPPEVTVEDTAKGKGKSSEGGLNRRKSVMSYFSLAQSKLKFGDKDGKKDKKIRDKDRAKMADDLHTAAETAKTSGKQEEEQDLSAVLDQLNLSAVNNRVFSFSKESEELLNKFKLVLKDIVNGVPTAYDDLTKLLTDSDNQMKKMYSSLPPFLQNLIKSLPAKMTATLGPELLAAQAEKPGFDGKQREEASKGKSKSKRSKRSRIPDLKSLISAEGAVATMLKSILNFLKLRFPTLMAGTNILLSLAVFRKSPMLSSKFAALKLIMPFQFYSSSSGTATNAAVRPVLRKKALLPRKPNPPSPAAHPPSPTMSIPCFQQRLRPPLPVKTPLPNRAAKNHPKIRVCSLILCHPSLTCQIL